MKTRYNNRIKLTLISRLRFLAWVIARADYANPR